jgi:hypothetical protein
MDELFNWILPPQSPQQAPVAQPQQPPAPSESAASQRRPQQRASPRPLRSPPRKPRAPLKFRVFVHDEEFIVSTRSVEGATWGWVLSQVIRQKELKEQRAARQAAVKQRRMSWGGAPSPEMWAGLHLRQGDKLDLGDEVHSAFAHDSPLGPLYATINTAACSTSGKPSKAPDAPLRTAGGRKERGFTVRAAPDERALERGWVEGMHR